MLWQIALGQSSDCATALTRVVRLELSSFKAFEMPSLDRRESEVMANKSKEDFRCPGN